MIALAAEFRRLHIPQQGIHFRQAQGAVGANRAVASHSAEQFIDGFFHPAGLAMLSQVGHDITDQRARVSLGQ